MIVGGAVVCLILFGIVIWAYNATGAIIATIVAFVIIMARVGLQLWTIREECDRDLERALRTVGAQGYDGVESRGSVGLADDLRAEFVALTQLQADALVTSDTKLARAVSGLVETAAIDALR